ncbi:hypothetical protein AB0D66_32850 [Streptomyces sp. NPDC048270]|uniref:hypothetical protein n=1 Tax=Streptomyces sp. NPDC048270 TaxID=3154615 RepID=UPI0033DD87D1
MPSLACFGDAIRLAEHVERVLHLPVHYGYVSKPRDGSLASRLKRMDLNDYGSLAIYSKSSNPELVHSVIQQIHPLKHIDIFTMT